MSALVSDAEQILRECFASFARYPNAALIDDPHAFGVVTEIPITFFSGIAATNIDDASDVDRIAKIFRDRGAQFRWWLTPSTRPTDLEAQLIARGFHHTYDANGMVADLARVDFDLATPRQLTIRKLEHVREFDSWLDVFSATFARPDEERDLWRDAYALFGFDDASPWQHFVGFVGDKPVSTSSLLMTGDLSGIYHVATLPQARGRGIGRAVTLAAMNHARDRGATRAVLQSSEMGFGVYRAIGFEDVCNLRLYDWKPEYAR